MELAQLGHSVEIPENPQNAVLETIENQYQNYFYCIRLKCPEFSSLCPATKQPDFGNFTIDYIPKEKLIESKSLKLFLGSFRNYGIFHEKCTVYVGSRIYEALQPYWLRIAGEWNARGGISINTYWQYGKIPDGKIPESSYIKVYTPNLD